MPILRVDVVLGAGEVLHPDASSRVADACAKALGTGAGGTWALLNPVAADCYAENGGGPPEGIAPVLVTVLQARIPAGGLMDREADQLAEAVAFALGRNRDCVHILFEPPAADRIYFGGRNRPEAQGT